MHNLLVRCIACLHLPIDLLQYMLDVYNLPLLARMALDQQNRSVIYAALQLIYTLLIPEGLVFCLVKLI
jgi:hypothetical protein